MLTLRFATRNGEKVVELLLIPTFFVHSITFQLTIFPFLTPLFLFYDSYCRRVGFLNDGKWEYFLYKVNWILLVNIELDISSDDWERKFVEIYGKLNRLHNI